VYQLYPRSFNDSDGVGDLPGARRKVPSLDDLGADVVWLTPVYDSPQVDAGYDVRNYYAIDDDYGTTADLEALLEAPHDRDIRLVMDLVVNHTPTNTSGLGGPAGATRSTPTTTTGSRATPTRY